MSGWGKPKDEWQVPERGKGESARRYRDKLNKQIDDYRMYVTGDTFPRSTQIKYHDRIKRLERAVRATHRPDYK